MSFGDLNVLHIANSYGGTAVYRNLFERLDLLGVGQTVFVPLNSGNHNRIGSDLIEFENGESQIVYNTSLKSFHKYFYSDRIKTIVRELKELLNNGKKLDLIHASTLCVDGAAAHEIKKYCGINYVVSVRGTDLNVYYKYFFFKREYYCEILKNASCIIFISPSLKRKFLNLLPQDVVNLIEEKIHVIPNGVDDAFVKNVTAPKMISGDFKVLYFGGIQRNKNIHSTIRALELLNNSGMNSVFTVIGKGLLHRRTTKKYVDAIDALGKQFDWIRLRNSLNKFELQKELSLHDVFVMPSFSETFGLSYVEALSQGLPIVYSKGQGFDGFFEDGKVGYSVNPNSVDDISKKIKLVFENYESIIENIKKIDFSIFDWNNVACLYRDLYKKSIIN